MKKLLMKWADVSLGKHKDQGVHPSTVIHGRCAFCGEGFFVPGSNMKAVCIDPIVLDQDTGKLCHPSCAEGKDGQG